MFDEIDRVLSLKLSIFNRGFSYKNEQDYNKLFALTPFGVSDTVKELVRLAKIGAQYDV